MPIAGVNERVGGGRAREGIERREKALARLVMVSGRKAFPSMVKEPPKWCNVEWFRGGLLMLLGAKGEKDDMGGRWRQKMSLKGGDAC